MPDGLVLDLSPGPPDRLRAEIAADGGGDDAGDRDACYSSQLLLRQLHSRQRQCSTIKIIVIDVTSRVCASGAAVAAGGNEL